MKIPAAPEILKLIKSEPATDQEQQCLGHLKQYIRLQGYNNSHFSCSLLLRVIYSAVRAVAHTCGPVFEIPSSYRSCNELSEEFGELLQNKEA